MQHEMLKTGEVSRLLLLHIMQLAWPIRSVIFLERERRGAGG
jgi:hypothetical protein